jgi:hypothetical protein
MIDELKNGCGVVITVPGTRYQVTAEVTEIADERIKVKGADYEGWITKEQVQSVLSPGNFALDNALNVIAESEE